ncbi:MAG: PIG-L deacetylase family protein [Chloroflexota bacterium]
MADPQFVKAAKPLDHPMKVVVIVAHHDDIEFGSSGTIAKWVEEGAEVTYVIVTDGGSGSNEPGIIREELAEQRKAEQIVAGQAVGVTDIRFLGYKDGTLQPTLELRRDLTRIIREVKPERVIAQNPTTVFFGDGYINHPDHRAAGEAAIYATFPSSETRPIFPELLDEGYEPHKVSQLWLTIAPEPTHYVDITAQWDKKIDSLRAHVSQLGEGEDFDNGVMQFIEERNAEGGARVGVKYAEYFKVMILQRANEEHREKDLERALVAHEAEDGN